MRTTLAAAVALVSSFAALPSAAIPEADSPVRLTAIPISRVPTTSRR